MSRPAPVLLAAAALLSAALAGCNQTAGAPPAPPPGTAAPGVTPSTFRLPEGGGCQGDVARFQAILKNDSEIGHLSASVYARASADVRQAETACASGREVQARTIVAQTKRNYGYPL